jgi:hypothetical protein
MSLASSLTGIETKVDLGAAVCSGKVKFSFSAVSVVLLLSFITKGAGSEALAGLGGIL